MLEENKKADLKVVSANSANFNFGVGYRYYVTSDFYLGLRAKYNIVDYSRTGKMTLRGNVFTLHMTVGWLNNQYRNYALKTMRYRHRR